jgi:hypothetical membrane protein
MKRYGLSLFISSILVLLSYSSCSLLSFFNYPLPYSPIKNWLSDLGNNALNPNGAIFYNIGIFITAVWLLLFFLGFSTLKTGKNRIQNLMSILTQIFGVFGCLSMALSAFVTIANPGPHSFLSTGLYISLGTAFAFSVAALRYDAKRPRWLLILGILTALFDMLTSLFFSSVPVFEWITVSLFLTYVVLLGVLIKSPGNQSVIKYP